MQVLFHARGYIWKRSNERLGFSNFAIDSGTFVCYTKKAQKRSNATALPRIWRILVGSSGAANVRQLFGCAFSQTALIAFFNRPTADLAHFCPLCAPILQSPCRCSGIPPIHGFPPGYGRCGRFFEIVCQRAGVKTSPCWLVFRLTRRV